MAYSASVKGNIARGVGRLSDLVIKSGKGSYVYTSEGRKLLDMTSGIGVVNTGHCHPKVVAAAQEQVGNLVHGQVNIAHHEPMLKLTETLLPIIPKGMDSIFYSNSGAEAVENAIKMARHATGKQNVVVMQGSYHGRTFGTMSMTTSSRIYRAKYGPLLPGIHVTPFPYEHHGVSSDDAMKELDLLFKQTLHPDEVAAIIMEPVLGEGGYVPAPADFLKRVDSFCKANGILFIADEVQTGFGRTGSLFACDSPFYGNITPDILVIAKGIASGFPLSAVVSRKEISDKQDPGSMGGTYAGNAVACAAAVATQQVIQEEGLVQNSLVKGEYLMNGLRDIQKRYPDYISDVRGLGCMVGVEFSSLVGEGFKAKFSQECLKDDMLILGCSVFETMRLIPPLTVSNEELDQALEIFENSMQRIITQDS